MIDDVPIYIDNEELLERPRFETEDEFAAYIIRIAEGRDMIIVLEHPHADDNNVIGVWIGSEPTYKCPHGCDEENQNEEKDPYWESN